MDQPVECFKKITVGEHSLGEHRATYRLAAIAAGTDGRRANMLLDSGENLFALIHQATCTAVAVVHLVAHCTKDAANHRFPCSNSTAYRYETRKAQMPGMRFVHKPINEFYNIILVGNDFSRRIDHRIVGMHPGASLLFGSQ